MQDARVCGVGMWLKSCPWQSAEEQEKTQHSTDLTAATQLYRNLEEAQRFVTHAKENAQLQVPECLQGKQRLAYDAA